MPAYIARAKRDSFKGKKSPEALIQEFTALTQRYNPTMRGQHEVKQILADLLTVEQELLDSGATLVQLKKLVDDIEETPDNEYEIRLLSK